MDRNGKIRKLKGWQRVKDRLRGLVGGFRKFKVDYLSDHSMLAYIDNIFQNLRSSKTSE